MLTGAFEQCDLLEESPVAYNARALKARGKPGHRVESCVHKLPREA